MKELMSRTDHTPTHRFPRVVLAIVAVILGFAAFIKYASAPKNNLPVHEDAPISPTRDQPKSAPAGNPRTVMTFPSNPPALALQVATQPSTSISLDDLAIILRDPAQPMKARIKAANSLLANGSNEALAVIKEVLRDGPSALRAAIAEGLGTCSNPESYSLMYGLLGDSDESVAMGAVRGLANEGSLRAANALSQKLYDATAPLNVRCEAALGLGSVDQPGTLDTLTRAAVTMSDEDIVTQVLNALGSRPLTETKGFIESYLKSPNVSTDLKVAALEALGESREDPSSLLLSYAANPDAELRASAAWAISNVETPGKAQEQLLAWLKGETDPTVRVRLFQALGTQDSIDVASIQALLGNESNPTARTAGLYLLAQALRESPTAE